MAGVVGVAGMPGSSVTRPSAAQGVLDVAARVARREFDIDDVAVLPVVRVDLAERLADDLLVLADTRPRESAEGGRLRARGVDLDPGDARVGGRCGEQRGERCNEGHAQSTHAARHCEEMVHR